MVNIFHENGPPSVNKLSCITRVSLDFTSSPVVTKSPRFIGTDEVHNFDVLSKPKRKRTLSNLIKIFS